MKPERLTLSQQLKRIGVDPLARMAVLAADTSKPVDLRAKLALQLTCYVRPKRRSTQAAASPFAAAEAKLAALGFDPVKCLVRIALDPKTPKRLRLKLARALARDYPLDGGRTPTDAELLQLLDSSTVNQPGAKTA